MRVEESSEDGDVLVVKVELLPFGFASKKRELCRLMIVNDGTGNRQTGYYDVATSTNEGQSVERKGRVENHPRQAHVLKLIAKALKSVGFDDA